MSRKYPHKPPNKKIRSKIRLITKRLERHLKDSFKQHVSAEYGLDAKTLESMAQAMLNDFVEKHTKPIISIRFKGIISKELLTEILIK